VFLSKTGPSGDRAKCNVLPLDQPGALPNSQVTEAAMGWSGEYRWLNSNGTIRLPDIGPEGVKTLSGIDY